MSDAQPNRGAVWLLATGVTGSCGALVGGYLAIAGLMAQGYLGLGFLRNAGALVVDALWANTGWALVLGALVGTYGALRPVLFKQPPAVPLEVPLQAHPAALALSVLAVPLTVVLLGLDNGLGRSLLLAGAGAGVVVAVAAAVAQRSEAARLWLVPAMTGLAVAALVVWGLGFQLEMGVTRADDIPALWRWGGQVGLLGAVAVLVGSAQPMLSQGTATMKAAIASGALPAASVVAVAAAVALPPSLSAGTPRSLLFINVDTLRHDHTSLDPDRVGDRPLTPNLAELATRSVVYDHAYSQAPWTLPANASILTGLYPDRHRATAIEGWLTASAVTLPELLRESGYATAAVVSHFYLATAVGFAQGFDHFDDQLSRHDTHAIASADVVTARALEWLDDRPSDQPFLLMAHYFDPHHEYLDRSEWDWTEGYSGWLTQPSRLELRRLQDHRLAAEDVTYLENLYDEEIAATDRAIGALLQGLDERGLTDEVTVVVYADHGDAFLDHGWLGHTTSVHEELVHVPLLVAEPGAPAARIPHVVETRSVFWTVLDWVGLQWTPDDRDRRSLTSAGPGDRAFSSVWLPTAPSGSGKREQWVGVRSREHALLRDVLRDRVELYDRALDPDEQTDLGHLDSPARRALGAELDAWLTAHPLDVGVRRALSPDEVQLLRDLGYL